MFELIKNVNIDFLGKRKISGILSGVVILAGMLSLLLHGGPHYSIDFEGGTEVQVLFNETTTVESVRDALSEIGYGDAADVPEEIRAAMKVMVADIYENREIR